RLVSRDPRTLDGRQSDRRTAQGAWRGGGAMRAALMTAVDAVEIRKAPVPEEVGPKALLPPGVKKGDRVFLGSILTCGRCHWCMDGYQNLCDEHLLYG